MYPEINREGKNGSAVRLLPSPRSAAWRKRLTLHRMRLRITNVPESSRFSSPITRQFIIVVAFWPDSDLLGSAAFTFWGESDCPRVALSGV